MMLNRTFALRTIPVLAVTIGLTGCMSSLHRQANALADATTPVVDEAAAAYRSANALYDTTVDYKAYAAFDQTPTYNPKTIGVLLTPATIAVRIKILQAFQVYVQNVVAITNGTDSPALQAASKSVGSNLTGLSNDLAPSFGITNSTSTTYNSNVVNNTTLAVTNSTITTTNAASPVTPAMRNGVSTAAYALGQFLIQRKIKRELPTVIAGMDPKLKTLCELLEDDIVNLLPREERDYDTLINLQTDFILANKNLSPEDRRNEIMKLPNLVRQQREAATQLKALDASIKTLYRTHHALATVAQGNSPQTLKEKFAELEAAGANLGTFYSSLSAN